MTLPIGGFSAPPFRPQENPPTSDRDSSAGEWVTPFGTFCHFTLPAFLTVLKDLTLHPERNSSLILRADPIPGGLHRAISDDESEDATAVTTLLGSQTNMEFMEELGVRLMPKQPRRDGKLDQRVTLWRSTISQDHPGLPESGPSTSSSRVAHDEADAQVEHAMVIMTPLVKSPSDIPYFHPAVRKVAFHYRSLTAVEEEEELARRLHHVEVGGVESDTLSGEVPVANVRGWISVSYLPFPPSEQTEPQVRDDVSPFAAMRRSSAPRKSSPLAGHPTQSATTATDPGTGKVAGIYADGAALRSATTERTRRTCLALLERVYKHGFGTMVGYQKRIEHDVVVKREPFQDLYLVLKDKHHHLESRAPKTNGKVEDVKRHVWKDIAIAAFLMLLWKEMYPARTNLPHREDGEEVMEWDIWGRPSGGFIDLGCGNGLLVHVLTSEGYEGKGYELRTRKTWPAYPPATRRNLVEKSLDPPSWFPETLEEWQSGTWDSKAACPIPDDSFLIGNHSDELTPWLPLISLLPSKPVPYLSLPCCLHTLSAAFTLSTFTPPSPPHPHLPPGGLDDGLEKGDSRYKAYIMWLGYVGVRCGWKWEKEGLRIPSTRGWGIVARNSWADSEQDLHDCRVYALGEVDKVRQSGEFKIREKEGKEH